MRHDLTLTDGDLTLRPLTEADMAPLMDLARASEQEYRQMKTPPTLEQFYLGALQAPDQMAFVKIVRGDYAGCTRYMEMQLQQRRLEIGSTWLAPAFMRTGVNRAVKRLLLEHAFTALGVLRVEIKTDILNTRSQAAIAGLGAVREGVLRQHMPRADGTQRDTVMFSVIAPEWPQVRARLASAAGRD